MQNLVRAERAALLPEVKVEVLCIEQGNEVVLVLGFEVRVIWIVGCARARAHKRCDFACGVAFGVELVELGFIIVGKVDKVWVVGV